MPTIRALYGAPTDAVKKVVESADDSTRRVRANARSLIYWEDGLGPLSTYVRTVYDSLPSQDDLLRIAQHTKTKNLLRRVADEIAMPLYARPPRRIFKSEHDAELYQTIAEDIGLDAILGEVAAMVVGMGKVHVGVRWSDDLGLIVDVHEPGGMVMVPHPDKRTVALGLGYATTVKGQSGEDEDAWVVWDAETYWTQDQKGHYLRGPEAHPYGRIPIVGVGAKPAIRDYWNRNHNSRLEDATLQLWTISTQMVSVLRDQGHLQLVLSGDAEGVPVSQSLGTRTILRVLSTSGTPTNLTSLDLQADLAQYFTALEKVETGVAAEYGYSLDRLNQKTSLEADDTLLRARTEELQHVMRRAERELFDVVKAVVDAHHPEISFSADARMTSIDYPPITMAPGVRQAILEIRELEQRQGTASPIDFVMQDNAEIRTRDEALEEFRQNIEDSAELARMRMAHNLRADANVMEQGQDPQANGAMGPKVRDGFMSRDLASQRARGRLVPEGE